MIGEKRYRFVTRTGKQAQAKAGRDQGKGAAPSTAENLADVELPDESKFAPDEQPADPAQADESEPTEEATPVPPEAA